MTNIKLYVNGAHARAQVFGELVAGTVGITIDAKFNDEWNGLAKHLVCRNGKVVKTKLDFQNGFTVAPEAMIAGGNLEIGFEGMSQDGKIVFPTVWASCGVVKDGANANDDYSADPTNPVWGQLEKQIGDLNKLETSAKNSIVDAVNEVAKKDVKIPVANAETLGGIKADPITEKDTQPVRIGENGMLYTAPGGSGGNVDLTGVVKSVNGIAPDENGNVEINIPEQSDNLNVEVRIGDWEMGNIADEGVEYARNDRIRSVDYLTFNSDKVRIVPSAGYAYSLHDYDSKKAWLSGSPEWIAAETEHEVSADHFYRLILKRTDDGNMTVAEGVNITVFVEDRYVLPVATAASLGGIKAEPAEETDTQPVRIGGDGKLYTAPGAGGNGESCPCNEYTFSAKVTVTENTKSIVFSEDGQGNPLALDEVFAKIKFVDNAGYQTIKVNGTLVSYRHAPTVNDYENIHLFRFGDLVWGEVFYTSDDDISGMNNGVKAAGLKLPFLNGEKIKSIEFGCFTGEYEADTQIQIFGR